MLGRKESVVSDIARTTDDLPSIVAKLNTSNTVWTGETNIYPFSRVLRIRVLQIVCGISILVMGAVACIEERGTMTNLALGVPAGLLTVLAAGASIHTSRGFSGYRASGWAGSSAMLRALGPSPLLAVPLVALWTAACTVHGALFVQSLLTIRRPDNYRMSHTRYQLAVVELFLSALTLGAVVEVLRVDLRHDPD